MPDVLKIMDLSFVRFMQTLQAAGMPAMPQMPPPVVIPRTVPEDEGKFPPRSGILQRQWPHAESSLARDDPKWTRLSGITVRYLFRRCLALWMGREVQCDLEENAHYPWATKAFGLTEWTNSKALCIGKKPDPTFRMTCQEEDIDSIFRR